MRKTKSIRLNGYQCEIINDLVSMYNETGYAEKVTFQNILEKLIINGVLFYLEKLEENQDKSEKISILRKKLEAYQNEMIIENFDNCKIISFTTEEKIHRCIEKIVEEERRILKHEVDYTTVLRGILMNGMSYYIDLLAKLLPYPQMMDLMQMKGYINSLSSELGEKNKFIEKD